ncbi:MAG TPA: RICIN domain-containing protein [Polyangia bacterium]
MSTDLGRTTITYMVKCALPAGRGISKQDQDGNWYKFAGEMGMAPQWETGVCDNGCQEAVSACLMAHVNTAGVHIPLWLVSPSAVVGWGRNPGYPNQEGTFFGNIFNPDQRSGRIDAFYCNGPDWAKSVVPGRLGANQANAPYANPFGVDALCAGHCVAADAPNQNDGFKTCMAFNTPVTVWRQNELVFDPSTTQRICSKLSGKCLDVWMQGQDNGVQVVQWDYVSGPNQQWHITAVGDGYYKICAHHSGKCLSVDGNSTANGANIQQWMDEGADGQRFAIEPMGGGLYSIVAKNDSKSLDVADMSMDNGHRIQQWDYLGKPNQLWTINAAQ